MPSSYLFGVNNEGRVHHLSTGGNVWRELPYVGHDFKKISAVPHFLWALGSDHQIYLYVYGFDIPIKVKEEAYENERWFPIEGFTSRLLPTDRFHFSNEDGTIDRNIEKIRLPSMAWQWESDWQLELSLEGQPLDHNGWTYAVDFPAQYYPKKQWSSCVRRRLWVRSRKYSAMNSWCAIAPLHKDATTEPFIDISIGGYNMQNVETGTMLVWAVSSHNRVMFRTDVSATFPEGAKWIHIPTPFGCEVKQISVGPTGLVWATLVDGRALVRINIDRNNLEGKTWVEVRGPNSDLKILQLSVGIRVLWAVTDNKEVWFRNGIRGDSSEINEEHAVGKNWTKLMGNMCQVSVTCNDQVFGIGTDDRHIYFRTDVCEKHLMGKRWKALCVHSRISRSSSNASLNTDRTLGILNYKENRPNSMIEQPTVSEWISDKECLSLTTHTSLPERDLLCKFEAQPKNPEAWSPVHSVGSIVGTEVYPGLDDYMWSENSTESLIFNEDEELKWADYEISWLWISASACTIDYMYNPNWFSETILKNNERQESWRYKILYDLKHRYITFNTSSFESAIDTHSQFHTEEARVSLKNNPFMDCLLHLEWMNLTASLTILNIDGGNALATISLNDVVCIQMCSEPGSPRLILHTPRNFITNIRLQFTNDLILEEWQGYLTDLCNSINGTIGRPSDESFWALTNYGDIFIWDPIQLESNQLREDDYFLQKYDLTGKEAPVKVALHTSCVPGTILTLIACVADEADRISINLEGPTTFRQKQKNQMGLENICLHFNPRFSENCVVRNSMINGIWGHEERDGTNPFQLGQEFRLKIQTTEDAFIIYVNDIEFTSFRHRLPCYSATILSLWGKLLPVKLLIKSPQIIMDPLYLYWRQIGGHLRRIETSGTGITWGIGYDHSVWVYNGGWGGSFCNTLNNSNVNQVTDSQNFWIYENQRWNPITGYTSAGLPTDRHMWSDSSGKQRRTKEYAKLLSHKWQWLSDWMIDFHVPGGADNEGWQYAIDFPASYHKNKHFTDYVRRRRWYRKCKITTSGPWQELDHTKLLDISLQPINNSSTDLIATWALALGGQVMIRMGVSRSNPMGNFWNPIASDEKFCSISCESFTKVWTVSNTGCAYYRSGIDKENIAGDKWVYVGTPPGCRLKQLSAGPLGVWAIDDVGRLNVRVGMKSDFPQGTGWLSISVDLSILNVAPETKSFKHVCVGQNNVFVLTDKGLLIKRLGVCYENPMGVSWDIGLNGNWQYISIRP